MFVCWKHIYHRFIAHLPKFGLVCPDRNLSIFISHIKIRASAVHSLKQGCFHHWPFTRWSSSQNIISACFAVSLQSEHPKPGKKKEFVLIQWWKTAVWSGLSHYWLQVSLKCRNALKQIFYPSIAAVLPCSVRGGLCERVALPALHQEQRVHAKNIHVTSPGDEEKCVLHETKVGHAMSRGTAVKF